MSQQWPPGALKAGAKVRNYAIQSVLGVGGFGITYLARDERLGRLVALKEHLPSDFAARMSDQTVGPISASHQDDYRWAINAFLKEAKTLAAFDTPAIVRVYDYFEMNGTAYMVMSYVEGTPLNRLIREGGPLSPEDARQLFLKVTGALKILHRGSIYHRDIKPANIIVSPGEFNPVLIDFGSARQIARSTPREVTTLVSEGFAPLEQYSTDASFQGPWTDIYSFAATLYYCLTGEIPANANTRSDYQRHGKPDPLIPLKNRRPELDKSFAAAIETGLNLRENDRPQSVDNWQGMIDWSSRSVLPTANRGTQPPPPVRPVRPMPPNSPHPTGFPETTGARRKKSKAPVILALLSILLIGGGVAFHFLNQPADDAGGKQQTTISKNESSNANDDLKKKREEDDRKRRVEMDELNRLKAENERQAQKLKEQADAMTKREAELARLANERERDRLQKEADRLARMEQEQKRRDDELAEEKRRREEAAAQTMSGREKALACAKNYYEWGSDDHPNLKQIGLLGSPVEFFGTTHQGHATIRSDHQKFCTTWTSRNFEVTGMRVVSVPQPNTFDIETDFNLRMSSSCSRRVGKRLGRLRIRVNGGEARIVKISSETIGTDQKIYDRDGQVKALETFVGSYFNAGDSNTGHSITRQLGYLRSRVSPYYRLKSATHADIKKDLLKYAARYPFRQSQVSNIHASELGSEIVTVICNQSVRTEDRNGEARSLQVKIQMQVSFGSGAPLISSIKSIK